MTRPLKVGDRVRVVKNSTLVGAEGVVWRLGDDGCVRVDCDGDLIWKHPEDVELLPRPKKGKKR